MQARTVPIALATMLTAAALLSAEVPVKVEVGKPAPDFALKDQDGKEVKLSSLKGKKNVLLAFYRQDFAWGCTGELTGFREEHSAFEKRDVLILGISTDPVASHLRFWTELRLPFPLLADEDGKVSKLYGILKTMPGGTLRSGRSAFVIDKEGVVRHADASYDLQPEADHEALLKAVGTLQLASGETKKPEKKRAAAPRIEGLKFGEITVNGKRYDTDVVIARGEVRERDKTPSRGKKAKYGGHTPLTLEERIPWDCKVLLIGIGMDGALPVEEALKKEAEKRGVQLILLETPKAVEHLEKSYSEEMNVILHVTC